MLNGYPGQAASGAGSSTGQSTRKMLNVSVCSRRCNVVTEETLLTHDERKAAEAAFRGLPLNSQWSLKAQLIYFEILQVTHGRAIVTDQAPESATLAVGT